MGQWTAETMGALDTHTDHTLRIDGAQIASSRTLAVAPSAFDNWTSLIRRETRVQDDDQLEVVFRSDAPPRPVDPIENDNRSKPSPMGRWILKEIEKNRSHIARGFIRFEPWAEGYVYQGCNRVQPTVYISGAQNNSSDFTDRVRRIIWEELDHEGKNSAVSAQAFTTLALGKGFHLGHRVEKCSDTLSPLLDIMFGHPAVARVFHAYGIAYHRDDGFVVANTKTGCLETGWNGAALIQTNRALLAVFALLAEDRTLGQIIADAKWNLVMNAVGEVPPFVREWQEPLIQLVAHLHLEVKQVTWQSFRTCRDAQDVLMTLGRLSGTPMPCGAYRIEGGWLGEERLQRWGGGIGWRAIQDVSKDPHHYPDSMLTNNSVQSRKRMTGLVLFPVSSALRENRYHPFDWIPGRKGEAADETHAYIRTIHTHGMRRLIATLKACGAARLQQLKATYSKKCRHDFGGRPLLVIDALLKRNRAHQKRIEFLSTSDDFLELPHGEQIELRDAVGLVGVDILRDLLERKRFCAYFKAIRDRDMPTLLSTIERHRRHVDAILAHLGLERCACNHDEHVKLALLGVRHGREAVEARKAFLTDVVEPPSGHLSDISRAALWDYLGFKRPGRARTPEYQFLESGNFHEYVTAIHTKRMFDLLYTLEGHIEHLFEILEHYRNCCSLELGDRLGCAIEAVEMRSLSQGDREAFVSDPRIVNLETTDRCAIRKYLSLGEEHDTRDDPDLKRWETGDRSGYIASIQGRSMIHLIRTLRKHKKYIYEIHHHYEAHELDYFGPRMMAAILAVEQSGENKDSRHQFLESSEWLEQLPRDEQQDIQRLLER